MKVTEGVKRYIEWKQANGFRYETSQRTLLGFCRFFDDRELPDVNAEHILSFLNSRAVTAGTWRLRYFILKRFTEHWISRDQISEFEMPTPRPAVRQTFVPYIFKHQELRSLLNVVNQSLNPRMRTDRETIRALLLFLYGTGASIGEAVLVQCSDLETEVGFVKIRSTRPNKSRRIPLGQDLQGILNEYMVWRSQASRQCPYLFVTKRDRQMSANTFAKTFGRIRRQTGGCRMDHSSHQPRVDDLRYTFAVHRITAWIELGFDLNRMLPALAAYMGQVGLGSTERYLFLTPERFRKDLDRLSPSRGKGNWHRDSELMSLLASL